MPHAKTIEPLARAVLLIGDDILLCQAVGQGWYYLPGGHIEYGETARGALVREVQEELGVAAQVGEFVGGSEHRFVQDGQHHQEINLLFSATLSKVSLQSQEVHIQFVRMPLHDFPSITLLPKPVHVALLQWLQDRKPFWIE